MAKSYSTKFIFILALLALAMTFMAFDTALTLGFMSEDENHAYLANYTVNGHWSYLLNSFTQPWMQAWRSAAFYRPTIDLSFISDALLYGDKSWGYHLSNLLFHAATAFNSGLITTILCSRLQYKRAQEAGLIATTLFAVNPLSQEVVVWIICRCDGLSQFLFTVSILTYLLYREHSNRGWLVSSLSAFIFAMGAKESAFILPAVVALYELVISGKTVKQNLLFVLRSKILYLYAATSVIFFAARFYFIGGIGGYTSSLGRHLDETIWQRLGTWQDWSALFYPINKVGLAVIAELPYLYSLAYGAIALGIICGLLKQDAPDKSQAQRVAVFSLGAALIALVPAYQSFMLNSALQGARALYLSLALSTIFVAYLLSTIASKIFRRLWVAFFALTCVLTANCNTMSWQRCARLDRALAEGCRLFQRQHPQSILSLLNIPFVCGGGAPPIDKWQLKLLSEGVKGDIAHARYLTSADNYLPMPDSLNPVRAAEQASAGAAFGIVYPEGTPFRLLDKSIADNFGRPLNQIFDSRALSINPTLPLHTLKVKDDGHLLQRANFVEVLARRKTCKPSPHPTIVEASKRNIDAASDLLIFLWVSDQSAFIEHGTGVSCKLSGDDTVCYRFPVGDRVSFKCATSIERYELYNLPRDYELISVTFKSGADLMPVLTSALNSDKELTELTFGQVGLAPGESLSYDFDVSAVPGARGAYLEVSEVNESFHHNMMSLFDQSKRARASVKASLGTTKGRYVLSSSELPTFGNYQIRVIALNDKGDTAGYFSMPRDIAFRDKSYPFKGTAQQDFERFIFDNRPPRQNTRY